MNSPPLQDLHERIENIESAYEFMLAYAAQGYEANQNVNQDHDIRSHLEKMDAALLEIGAVIEDVAAGADGDAAANYHSFISTVAADADKARGAVRLVLARAGISSQLIDNLNASIHLRALLTDLFLLDEAFKV